MKRDWESAASRPVSFDRSSRPRAHPEPALVPPALLRIHPAMCGNIESKLSTFPHSWPVCPEYREVSRGARNFCFAGCQYCFFFLCSGIQGRPGQPSGLCEEESGLRMCARPLLSCFENRKIFYINKKRLPQVGKSCVENLHFVLSGKSNDIMVQSDEKTS